MKITPLALSLLTAGLAAAAPAQIRPDQSENRSLRIIQTEDPRFPLSLTNSHVMEGKADLAISLDRNGKLQDWLVTGYSRKEFADSALAALKQWQFEPPLVNGEPWGAVQDLHIDFSRTGVVISFTGVELVASLMDERFSDHYSYRAYALRELDHIPTPIKVVTPVAPPLPQSRTVHAVTVEFYIDEQGDVRLPRVDRAVANDVFAASAMEAVRQWRFEPPRCHGRPVLVLAKQEFRFVAKP